MSDVLLTDDTQSLLVACLEQNARDAAWQTNNFIAYYDTERATVAAIREGVLQVLDVSNKFADIRDLMRAIEYALYPSRADIERHKVP